MSSSTDFVCSVCSPSNLTKIPGTPFDEVTLSADCIANTSLFRIVTLSMFIFVISVCIYIINRGF